MPRSSAACFLGCVLVVHTLGCALLLAGLGLGCFGFGNLGLVRVLGLGGGGRRRLLELHVLGHQRVGGRRLRVREGVARLVVGLVVGEEAKNSVQPAAALLLGIL